MLFILVSCGQQGNDTGSTSVSQRLEQEQFNSSSCSCALAYQPVCGNNGVYEVTFINSCLAQCNGMEYTDGICPTAGTSTSCASSSGQVCARPFDEDSLQTYSNDCQRKLAKAAYISAGSCQ